ncbi:MAG: HAD-IC family P-type ATPase [Clostridia bacterium]|nr:HAD-IC family P-type ATPase [Clostridia bacterium]
MSVEEKKLPEGLSSAEAERLKAEGLSNVTNEKNGKSYGEIITSNLFTFFNMVWAIVAIILVIFKSYSNLTFLAIIIPNVLIAIIQEVRAKRTVEKISVTTNPTARVVRDGEIITVKSEDIVLGDVMWIELGEQILSDAVVVSGLAEANESMLTGESNAIKKTDGDELLAGSFLVSGGIFAKVTRVGKDNYVHKIEKAAKGFKAPASNLFRDLNNLIKYIGMLLVPMAALMLLANWFAYRENYDFAYAVIKTCGSVIGMIPAGAYLLVTITLTLSVIILAKKRTLVQDMYSIEMLASADVVCLDKTGTITDGTMYVTAARSLDGTSDEEIRRIMAIVEGSEMSINNTSRALIEYFGKEDATITDRIPFSSERKFSAVDIEGVGAYAIGAPHFTPCEISAELDEEIDAHAKRGERVLVLARLNSLGGDGVAVAMIAISDRIRPAAAETIAKFQDQGVTVKIISGDHAATVSSIAARVGVNNAEKYISCEKLTDEELLAVAEDYAVFGRVTPEQKVLLIKELKRLGHTVAMTGDGVNDTLALKESNCAIAMGEGSDVAKKVSQIVLLDSDFSTLPDVVREGRRCINNVRQSASLFLMKTILTIALSLYAIVTVSGYPFEPSQFMPLELFVIGIASVLLALEPNNERIKGSFLEAVLVKSVPSALALFIPTLAAMIVASAFSIDEMTRNAVAMLTVTIVGFVNLVSLCRPFNKWRFAVVGIVALGLCVTFPVATLFLGDMLKLIPAFDNMLYLFGTLGIGLAISFVFALFGRNIESGVSALVAKIKEKKKAKRAK